MSRRAPGAAATNTLFSKAQSGLLKRGKAALEPAKPEPKPKSPKSKHDPAHPIRGGGVRKKAYASRPTRRKGTPEWLSRQLDSWQERTLRIAYYIHKHLPSRLQVSSENAWCALVCVCVKKSRSVCLIALYTLFNTVRLTSG